MTKYKAVRTNGFASKRESRRFDELKLLEKAGEISELSCQPGFRLEVNGDLICKYIADFAYRDKQGMPVTEDVKSPATSKLPVYRIKKKLIKALYGIVIKET